jgi:hypothetical protein
VQGLLLLLLLLPQKRQMMTGQIHPVLLAQALSQAQAALLCHAAAGAVI